MGIHKLTCRMFKVIWAWRLEKIFWKILGGFWRRTRWQTPKGFGTRCGGITLRGRVEIEGLRGYDGESDRRPVRCYFKVYDWFTGFVDLRFENRELRYYIPFGSKLLEACNLNKLFRSRVWRRFFIRQWIRS